MSRSKREKKKAKALRHNKNKGTVGFAEAGRSGPDGQTRPQTDLSGNKPTVQGTGSGFNGRPASSRTARQARPSAQRTAGRQPSGQTRTAGRQPSGQTRTAGHQSAVPAPAHLASASPQWREFYAAISRQFTPGKQG